MSESAVLARLRRGPGTVAYLGTSVSVQRSGFRPRVHTALEEETGHEHRSVLAGVGGADALAGVFAVDALVSPHKPDVCFVEFATNDARSTTPREDLDDALAGVVRKLLRSGCEPCLLQLPLQDGLAPRRDETQQRSIEVSQRLGVPLVRLDEHLGELADKGALSPADVLRDGLHLGSRGAQAAADHILDVLRHDAGPAVGGARDEEGRFDRTTVAAIEPAWFDRPDELLHERLNLVQPYLRIRPGNAMRCRYDQELVGVLTVIGPASGWMRVSHDGQHEDRLLWDVECTYNRLSIVTLDRRVPAGSELTLEVLDRPVERWGPGQQPEGFRDDGPDLRLISVLLREDPRP